MTSTQNAVKRRDALFIDANVMPRTISGMAEKSRGMSEAGRTALGQRLMAARLAAATAENDYANKSAVSRLVGVRPETIWRYEEKGTEPTVGVALRLAALYGVTVEWLVRGDGTSPALERWKATPRGRNASEAALSWLAAIPMDPEAPPHTVDLLLAAYESGAARK